MAAVRGGGADTIVMPINSTQRLTAVNNTDHGPTGLPVIRSTITIAGNDSTIRRALTAPRFRILAVGRNGNLTLRRTTLSGGVIRGDNGGGPYNRGGTVRLINSTISGNEARQVKVDVPSCPVCLTPAPPYVGGEGGGVFIALGGDVTPTLTVTNSTVSDNTADAFGGGVACADVATVIAPPNPGSRLTLINSTISGNEAGSSGGGVFNSAYGITTLTNSTISGNTAVSYGGGVTHRGFGSGTLTLTNTTITGNTVVSFGGGLATYNSPVLSPVLLKRTLIAGNTANNGAEVHVREAFAESPAANVVGGNFNLLGYRRLTNTEAFDGFTSGATDITATSNGNTPTALSRILSTNLSDRDGPTQTHAVGAASPAVDAVSDGTCPPPLRDQRGVIRPQDGNGDGGVACDIGGV